MSTAKKNGKLEDVQAALQALIAQGKKEGMIRDTDLNNVLSKMNLSPDKIEEIYDRFEAMNIQITTSNLDALDDGLDVLGGALDDALKRHRRTRVARIVFLNQRIQFRVDENGQVVFQIVQSRTAFFEKGTGFGVVASSQQQMFQRGVFVGARGGEHQSALQSLFQFPGQHGQALSISQRRGC